jgi:5-enolpyruvylshikimate-3-phosphate synthase
MTTRSQCASIAAHLAKPGARLTSLDALRLYGCSRAAARVDELRKAGMAIKTDMVRVIGRNGVARVAEYSLAVKV